MRERGVLIGTTGRQASTLKIRPPLVIRVNEARPGRGHPGRGPGGTRGTLSTRAIAAALDRRPCAGTEVVTVETRQGAAGRRSGRAERCPRRGGRAPDRGSRTRRPGAGSGRGTPRCRSPATPADPRASTPARRSTASPSSRIRSRPIRSCWASAASVLSSPRRDGLVEERQGLRADERRGEQLVAGSDLDGVAPVMWRTAPASSTNLVIGVSVGGRAWRDCRPGAGQGTA